MKNFRIRFVPYVPQDAEIMYLLIQAEDKFEAERLAFDLSIVLGASKARMTNQGFTVYETYPPHDEFHNPDPLLAFFVMEF